MNYERENQLLFNGDKNIGTYEGSHHLEEFQFRKQASGIRLCLQWDAGLQQHRQDTQVRGEPDTNQLISGDVGHTRIDDILDDVDVFSWNSIIPKKIVRQRKTTREEKTTYDQADSFSFALTIDAKKEACSAIEFLSGNIACKTYARSLSCL